MAVLLKIGRPLGLYDVKSLSDDKYNMIITKLEENKDNPYIKGTLKRFKCVDDKGNVNINKGDFLTVKQFLKIPL